VSPPIGTLPAALSRRRRGTRGLGLASAGGQEASDTFELAIDFSNGVPIYRQIVNQVLNLSALGLLKPDEALPSIRALALELKVAPNTISRAYEELETAGLVHKRRGLGTFVSFLQMQKVNCEQQRIVEQKINALMVDAYHLNFTPEALLQLIHRQLARKSLNRSADKGC
jgi:GntR family transcriptional regulator